jgi:hypothetical protein
VYDEAHGNHRAANYFDEIAPSHGTHPPTLRTKAKTGSNFNPL